MKKYFILSLVVLGVSGCNDLTGKTNVREIFKINNGHSQLTVSPGMYDTTMQLKKDKINMTLKNKNQNFKVTIKFEGSQQIPTAGQFIILAKQSGQPFDVYGKTQQKITEGPTQNNMESCTYKTTETVCTPQGCFNQVVNRWGQRQVEYIDETTEQDLAMTVSQPGHSNRQYASVTGSSMVVDRRYSYVGVCF